MKNPSIRIQETIDRPVQDVFEFFSNMENSPQWGRTLKTTKASEGPISIGTVFSEESKLMGQLVDVHTEVIEYDSPTKFSYTGDFSNGIREQANVTFEAIDEGTRFTLFAEAEMGKVARLLSPLFSWVMKRQVTSLFNNLKNLLEARA